LGHGHQNCGYEPALRSGGIELLSQGHKLDTVLAQELEEGEELEEDEEIELVLYPQPKSLWEALAGGDFFGMRQRDSLGQWLEEQVPFLSDPAPWLLMPEARIY